MIFPTAVPEIPAANVDKAVSYYVNVLGFTLDGLPHVGLFRAIHGTGSDFITGGAFGPDGGIGCIAVLLAAIAVLCARLAFRRDRPANFSHAGFV